MRDSVPKAERPPPLEPISDARTGVWIETIIGSQSQEFGLSHGIKQYLYRLFFLPIIIKSNERHTPHATFKFYEK